MAHARHHQPVRAAARAPRGAKQRSMADDWLTAGEPEADDDWLTDGVAPKSGKEPPSAEPETGAGGGGGDGDDEDWLASSVEYTAAEVLYGSPCGFAVPLGHTYWCDQSQRLISEQVRPRDPPATS